MTVSLTNQSKNQIRLGTPDAIVLDTTAPQKDNYMFEVFSEIFANPAPTMLSLSIILFVANATITVYISPLSNVKRHWYLLTASYLGLAISAIVTLQQHLLEGVTLNLAAEVARFAAGLMALFAFLPFRKVLMLRSSMAKAYEHLLNSMRDTYYRANAAGEVELISASSVNIVGLSPVEMVGRRVADFYEKPEEYLKLIQALADNGDIIEGHLTWVLHENGQRVALENNARLLRDNKGNITGIEGVVRDITERIKTESQNAEMGRIVEASVNEIFVFDAHTRKFVMVNESARLNLGYTLPELLGMTITALMPENAVLDMDTILNSLASGEETVVHFDCLMRRKDGTEYPAEVSLQYSRTQLRPVFFGILYDLTARRKVEEELGRSRRIHSLGQLTGGVAHDFNNMLQALQMNLEKLKPDDKKKLTWYSSAERTIERSAQLTQRLLAFARRQTLLPKVVDVNLIVQELAPLLALTLSEAVRIEYDLQTVELRAEVDQSQIENALLNLVINARDAMPDSGKLYIGTRQIQLSARQAFRMDELSAGDYVEICITDNGTGMTPAVLLNAIEPFYTTKPTIDGTGLGLSMVYGFAKQSGGHLSIQSELSQGTNVKLYFPVSEKPLSLLTVSSSSDSVLPMQSELVLLIEDDPLIRELTFGTLENLGYQALAARNGDEAIRLITAYKDKVRLVISDVLLAEGETGPDVVEQIMALQGGIGTIFISGHTREYWDDKHRFPEQALFLHKPFKQQQLKVAIEQLLRRPAATDPRKTQPSLQEYPPPPTR